MRHVYLDHNATTPVRPEVVEAMTQCLSANPGNPSSLHRFGRAAADAREEARSQVARAVGCRPAEVVFTSGGTEANNLALRGIGNAAKSRIVIGATEHEAVLQTVEDLSADGLDVTILPVDGEGRIAPESLETALRRETTLVSLMAANNETGVLASLSEIGEICRAKGVPLQTDAVQCFGKAPFRFDELPVDLASISSHKIGGPKGVGALIVGKGTRLRAQITGGGQERRIRPGTENLPGIVGFGKAAELAVSDLSAGAARLSAMRDRLESEILAATPGARVNGSGAPRLPNTTNITFPGIDGQSLMIALDLEGIAVSTGAACTAGASEPSHVLLAMGRSHEEAAGSIRFSLGWTSSESEIEEVARSIPGIVKRLANAGSTV